MCSGAKFGRRRLFAFARFAWFYGRYVAFGASKFCTVDGVERVGEPGPVWERRLFSVASLS